MIAATGAHARLDNGSLACERRGLGRHRVERRPSPASHPFIPRRRQLFTCGSRLRARAYAVHAGPVLAAQPARHWRRPGKRAGAQLPAAPAFAHLIASGRATPSPRGAAGPPRGRWVWRWKEFPHRPRIHCTSPARSHRAGVKNPRSTCDKAKLLLTPIPRGPPCTNSSRTTAAPCNPPPTSGPRPAAMPAPAAGAQAGARAHPPKSARALLRLRPGGPAPARRLPGARPRLRFRGATCMRSPSSSASMARSSAWT